MTREEICREFAKLNGIEWHEKTFEVERRITCSCKKDFFNAPRLSFAQHVAKVNPTLSRPEEVLAMMMKRKDWIQFADRHFDSRTFRRELIYCIPIPYITEPDKLLYVAHQWSLDHPLV